MQIHHFEAVLGEMEKEVGMPDIFRWEGITLIPQL